MPTLLDEPADSYAPFAAKWTAALIASLWISIPAAVQSLLVLMAIDYATGLICAAIKGQLSAAAGFRGIARKVLTLLLVGTASYISRSMKLGWDCGAACAMAFSLNELISITENCALAGVPIPETLLIVVVRAKRMAGRTKTAEEVERALAASAGAEDPPEENPKKG